jgi:hypothetical protein
LGEAKARLAAGEGGRIEWSVRTMRANSVLGMWQSTQVALPAAWWPCAAAVRTRSAWQGRHAWSAWSRSGQR